jgi:hypothetical protein
MKVRLMNDQEFHDPDFEALLDFLRASRGFDFRVTSAPAWCGGSTSAAMPSH